MLVYSNYVYKLEKEVCDTIHNDLYEYLTRSGVVGVLDYDSFSRDYITSLSSDSYFVWKKNVSFKVRRLLVVDGMLMKSYVEGYTIFDISSVSKIYLLNAKKAEKINI